MVLKSFDAAKKIALIKEVRDFLKLGLKEVINYQLLNTNIFLFYSQRN